MCSYHRTIVFPWLLCVLLILGRSRLGHAQNTSTPVSALSDDGFSKAVQWDSRSLFLHGKRLFVFGGEFHPFRIPVPELWEDILQKIKAMGMNSVSMYNHWGLQAPNATTLDFTTGAHNFESFYEYAKQVGLFVTARPGPYINAELSAGGMPLWSTTGGYGALRNNNTLWTDAWTPYMNKMAEATKPYQVTQDGTVLMWQVENEYPNQWKTVDAKTPNPTAIAYYQKLEKNARDNGIDVPFTANMPSTSGKSWSTDYDTVGAGGDVNLYGLDSYPTCWSCVPSDCSKSNPIFTLLDYYDHFQGVSPSQPPMIPEFQGGSLNPWDGPAGGCLSKSDVDFMNVYLRDNIAQKISIISLYMIFGGTNWGWLSVPFVPTTYDYGAAIAEDRSLRDKFYEIKLIGLFTRGAEDLPGATRIGTGTNYTTNKNIFTTELYNPETGGRFYVTRHNTPTSATDESFKLSVTTSVGNFSIPQISENVTLNGYISKILPVDFHFGNETLIYSTVEVLSYVLLDGIPTIAFWVPSGEPGEIYFKNAKSGAVARCNGCSSVGFYNQASGLIVVFRQDVGLTVIELDNGCRVLLMDRHTAWSTWIPGLNNDPTVPVDNTGPYLVRSANVSQNTLFLDGDSNTTSTIEVFAKSDVTSVSWNGQALEIERSLYGSLKASVGGPSTFDLPLFGTWKTKDSLPEKALLYADTGIAWVAADHTTTLSTTKTSTKPFLYSDEYGFYAGVHLWRGYFNGIFNASGVYLNVQGGLAFGYSIFLNGNLIGSYYGDANTASSALSLSFANATINKDTNVILVIQDDSGHDEGSAALNPRGILNATLLGTNSTSFQKWKVAGTAGGAFNETIDAVRTYYNEGGLTGERLGWHLPGFDDQDWENGSPDEGFTGASVKFYRTTMDIDAPEGHDISISFTLTPTEQSTNGNAPFRALLFINGYQYGRFNPHIRETNPYPVPPGILNYKGENTIAVAVWAQTQEGAAVNLTFNAAYVVRSSLNVKFESEYLRPAWTSDRLNYF